MNRCNGYKTMLNVVSRRFVVVHVVILLRASISRAVAAWPRVFIPNPSGVNIYRVMMLSLSGEERFLEPGFRFSQEVIFRGFLSGVPSMAMRILA